MSKGIVICGFMGAGKSRIGRMLAGRLGYRFDDLDQIISQMENQSISEIFEQKGEAYFRNLEAEYIKSKANESNRVLSLGGGSLQNQEIVQIVKASNCLVFINTSFETILDRIHGKSKRPLVLHQNGEYKSREELKNDLMPLFQKRLEFYDKADVTLTTEPEWDALQATGILLNKLHEYGYEV